MMKIVFLLLLHTCFGAVAVAQTSKKDASRYYKTITKLDTLAIQNGEHLEHAKTFSLGEFIEYYVENGKDVQTKKFGRLSMAELYKDSLFTYFGRKNYYGLIDFFKVSNTALTGIDYARLDGNVLRRKFIDSIVPQADKQKEKEAQNSCSTGNYAAEFKYKYYGDKKELEVTYKWKIGCDFVKKILNKTYTARYSLVSGEFIK